MADEWYINYSETVDVDGGGLTNFLNKTITISPNDCEFIVSVCHRNENGIQIPENKAVKTNSTINLFHEIAEVIVGKGVSKRGYVIKRDNNARRVLNKKKLTKFKLKMREYDINHTNDPLPEQQ